MHPIINNKQYIPYAADRVIGIIVRRTAFYYYVDIKGPMIGLLGVLEFEGATKRNKPELNVGDIVFCRVSISDRDMQPILTDHPLLINHGFLEKHYLCN